MSRLTQLEVLRFWFNEYDTINLAQAKAGLPPPNDGPRVHIERVAPLIHELRNEGWVISTGKDAAGFAYYRVISKPEVLAPGAPGRVPREPKPVEKSDPRWVCTKVIGKDKQPCLSGVVPDQKTVFDARYTTGKCFTHGHVVLAKR